MSRALKAGLNPDEALPPSLAQQFFDFLPHATLDNLYGPTEGGRGVATSIGSFPDALLWNMEDWGPVLGVSIMRLIDY